MAELRYNPLTKDYVMIASHRQNRPQMPKDWCPFCPGSGNVPDSYDVFKYDNDFPALSTEPPEPDPVTTELYKTAPSYGKCEVILYSPDHNALLHQLSDEHVRKLVELWTARYIELSADPKVKYVFIFENRGEEVGVTMPHPHGQIYAFPFIPKKLALELEASLKKLGMDVKLTRRDDRYLKLDERTTFANDNNADVFISLHCNALPRGRHAKGVELYLMADSTDKDALDLAVLENRELSGNAQNAAEVNAAADKKTKLLLMILGDMQQNDKINESTALAEHLYERMSASGLSIRKVRQAPFFVLKGAGMPALLVEMGYITERSDANQLKSQAYRKKMMDATALGISNYLKRGS